MRKVYGKEMLCGDIEHKMGTYVVRLERIRGLRVLTVTWRTYRFEIVAKQRGGTLGSGHPPRISRNGCAMAIVSRKRLPWKQHSKNPVIRRWVLAAASEFEEGGVIPRWSIQQIRKNLRNSTGADYSAGAISVLIQKYPAVHDRRINGWKEGKRKTAIGVVKFRGMDRSQRLAALDAVMAGEVKGKAKDASPEPGAAHLTEAQRSGKEVAPSGRHAFTGDGPVCSTCGREADRALPPITGTAEPLPPVLGAIKKEEEVKPTEPEESK